MRLFEGDGMYICNVKNKSNSFRPYRKVWQCIVVGLLIVTNTNAIPLGRESEARELNKCIAYVWGRAKYIVKDFDGNGEVNCCDTATAFCIKWKATYSLPVRLCQQQTAKFNHMYVQILTNWGWWSVDPEYNDWNGSHDMVDVWGWKYSVYGDNPNGYWARYFMDYVNRGY